MLFSSLLQIVHADWQKDKHTSTISLHGVSYCLSFETSYIFPVDGVWSQWADWATCSVTCAGGSRSRDRTCEFPPDKPQGDDCAGNSTQAESCNTQQCPGRSVIFSWLRYRLWFSTKTCSCYSAKTYVDNVILILKLNLTSLRNIIH